MSVCSSSITPSVRYHLPGLFEFYDFYRVFLPLYRAHREYFYDWCDIGSLYGAPSGCIWGGGRVSESRCHPQDALALAGEYGISALLTFSNSLLQKEDLTDHYCNAVCRLFEKASGPRSGVIVHSELLLSHLRKNYPGLYLVSSTTKVLTEFTRLREELDRSEFSYVVPDFRLNKDFKQLATLNESERRKVEFLCNECCSFSCRERYSCYEAVSRKNLGLDGPEHICTAPDAAEGYRFSRAMRNPGFIGIDDITGKYLPMHFTNFKIEGRSLGSALILEFLLYYMTKPEYQLSVREAVYLDSSLDLF
ncbi:MAG: hypothetical protein PUE04_00830 [Lachnospira sp.]|nr:hypothetical protein [Lachnospira sp.]